MSAETTPASAAPTTCGVCQVELAPHPGAGRPRRWCSRAHAHIGREREWSGLPIAGVVEAKPVVRQAPNLERRREILAAVAEHGGQAAAARALGISRARVGQVVAAERSRAATTNLSATRNSP